MKQLIIFTASWCAPCKALKQTLTQTNVPVDKITQIDIDEFPNTALEYKVRSVPTLVLYLDGKEVNRTTGFQGPNNLVDFCTT